jgi:hypothetical protein
MAPKHDVEVGDLCTHRTIESLGASITRAGQTRSQLSDRRLAFLCARHVLPLVLAPVPGRLPERRYRGRVDDLTSVDENGTADADDTAAGSDARDWTPPRPTGVPAVDAAVERLADLKTLPTGEHVAVYDTVHRLLQDALADLDGT